MSIGKRRTNEEREKDMWIVKDKLDFFFTEKTRERRACACLWDREVNVYYIPPYSFLLLFSNGLSFSLSLFARLFSFSDQIRLIQWHTNCHVSILSHDSLLCFFLLLFPVSLDFHTSLSLTTELHGRAFTSRSYYILMDYTFTRSITIVIS